MDALSNNWNRDRIIQEIIKKGFPAYHGGCSEIYLEKCFIKSGLNPSKRLNNAKILGETSLMFLVHPTITIEQMNNYAEVILEVLNKACR